MSSSNHIISAKKTDSKSGNVGLVSVIILSEKQAKGMKSCGPIPLFKISGQKTLLERQIDAVLKSFKSFEIILCAGFDICKVSTIIRSKFKNLNIRIVENQLHYNSNCCESARLCFNNTLNENLIVLDGSVMISHDDLQSIEMTPGASVMFQEDNEGFDIGVIHNNNILENLSIGIKMNPWNGVFSINGHKHINNFLSILNNPDFKNKLLFEAINSYNSRFGEVRVKKSNQNYTKLDNLKNFKRINSK